MQGATLKARIEEMLSRVGLSDRANEKAESFSGGMQRRLELTKGLLHRPSVLLLDEPTTGLDPGARRDVWQYLQILRDEERVSVIVTTHLMEEAERLCDRVAIMDHGRIIDIDQPQRLVDKYCPERSVILATADADAATSLAQIPGVASVTPHDGRYTIRGEGDRLITDVIRCLSDNHITVTDFRTETPNLEDVFLRITGHSIRD
jgi:ABC-2 type transport system ATP-binding protein